MSRHDKLTVRQSSLMKCQLQLQEADFSLLLGIQLPETCLLRAWDFNLTQQLPLSVPYRDVESNQIVRGQVIKSY